MDQIRLDPQDKLPPPTPRTHCQQNTLPQQDKKVPAAHPPLRIISGTALTNRSLSKHTGHCGQRCGEHIRK